MLESLLAGTGKRVDARGEARLAALVGEDARTLAAEVAKLAAYVGDRKVDRRRGRRRASSRASRRTRSSRSATPSRRATSRGALGVLDRAVADGGSPFMLLGSLASTVRRLVVERERARAGRGRPARSRVVRRVAGRRAPVDPGGGARREEAVRVLDEVPGGDALLPRRAARRPRRLAEADVAMKSGQDGRIRLERVLVGLLGEPTHERSAP